MLQSAWWSRSVAFVVLGGVLGGCAQNAAPPKSQSNAAAKASASSNPEDRAKTFVADVLAGGADLEKKHSLVMVGPALAAEIEARQPSFDHLGSAVSIMNESHEEAGVGRMCGDETCSAFLRAKGLRDVLLPFAAAQYRSATVSERQTMLDRSPNGFPEDTVATTAVAGNQVLGIYAFVEGMVWLELISKPFQVTHSASEELATPEQKAIDAARCIKLEVVELDQPEDVFAANTSAEDVASGVSRLVVLLDSLLLKENSQATGPWKLKLSFAKNGLNGFFAPPKPGVDSSLIKQLGDLAAGQLPASRGPELSFQLELTLRPCSK